MCQALHTHTPAGMALPFGVMVRQLKRSRMLDDITQARGAVLAASC